MLKNKATFNEENEATLVQEDDATLNEDQKEVVACRDKSTIVSASAGTGKTTTMIKRLLKMVVYDKVDLSKVVVVTFTKLAANNMREKLAEKFMELSKKFANTNQMEMLQRVVEQTEKLDNCAISTLHSFCATLLRNYFHVVDIDPSFTMLDDYALSNLKNKCIKKVLEDYYNADDEVFDKLFKIYATKRNDTNFVKEVLRLYEKSRTHVDFYQWYQDVRNSSLNFKGSKLETEFNKMLSNILQDLHKQWLHCADIGKQYGVNFYVEACQDWANLFSASPDNTFEQNFTIARKYVEGCKKISIPRSNENKWRKLVSDDVIAMLVGRYQDLKKESASKLNPYVDFEEGITYDQLLEQSAQMVVYIDKFMEVLQRFDELFADEKRKMGVVDFNDLEHFALAILKNQECNEEIRTQYPYIFVDEHQDTNPVQAEIIKQLAGDNVLFLVGDVKQSIYGFRGCTPQNFVDSIKEFQQDPNRKYVELNQNYRSHKGILNFVNVLMDGVMTEDFGGLDYNNTSMFVGHRDIHVVEPTDVNRDVLPPVLIDVYEASKIKETPPLDQIYDITTASKSEGEDQAEGEDGAEDAETIDNVAAVSKAIAHRIKHLVGSEYIDYSQELPEGTVLKDGDKDPRIKTIGYKDIAILSRTRGEYPFGIYHQLQEHKIPVVGSFKMKGLDNKEVRTLISMLRVIDNPHSDIAFVGVLLSCFCNLTEQQVADIKMFHVVDDESQKLIEQQVADKKIRTHSFRGSFYNRAKAYADKKDNDIAKALKALFDQIERYRLFSYGTTVDQLLLEIVASTNYHLYVSGLKNSSVRLTKMYDFIDQIKDKEYSQSVDKFIRFLDETSFDDELDEDAAQDSAVKFMTMHASKGLEFPVVIFVGGTKPFKNDTDTLAYDAVYGTALNHYDFETRLKTTSLIAAATKELSKKATHAEELRLLYVALTRAQNHLIIPIPQDFNKPDNYNDYLLGKKSVQNVNSYKNWLLRAIGKVFDWKEGNVEWEELIKQKDDGKKDLVREKDGVRVTIMDAEMYKRLPAKGQDDSVAQSTNKSAILAKIDYVYPHTSQAVPSKIASSSLDAHKFDLNEDAQTNSFSWESLVDEDENKQHAEGKKQLGTAYHKVYETIDYSANMQQIELHVQSLVDKSLIDKDVAKNVDVNLIYQTLSNPTFKQIVSSGKVYHEMPFLMPVNYSEFDLNGSDATTLLQGVIDMLVVCKDKAIVVDFKFTSNSYKLEERYQKQLQSYRKAVEEIIGLPVDCYLLSIADNKLIQIN